jgi:putative transposase
MARIKDDIKVSLSKSCCFLRAYVIMTNHLHFLVTPPSKAQLSTLMQTVANRYARYFNAEYQRAGTICEKGDGFFCPLFS